MVLTLQQFSFCRIINRAEPWGILEQTLIGYYERLLEFYIRKIIWIFLFDFVIFVNILLVFVQCSYRQESVSTLITRNWILMLFQMYLVCSMDMKNFSTFITRRFLPLAEMLVNLHMC